MDQLVERAQRGDVGALEELLAGAAPTVLRFARRMCKSAVDADDVLQETLLAAATGLPRFEGRASLSSWLFALARSACARKRRGLANRPHQDAAVLEDQPDPSPDPEASVEARQLATTLERALASLSDEHREVLLLRDVEGLSAAETAAAIGISVEAVKSRLHRARAALREGLAPHSSSLPGCPDVVRALSQKLEGDLTPLDCAQMEAHVAGCPACGAVCEELRGALSACSRAKDEQVTPAVRARVQRALDAVRSEIAR